MTLRLVANNFSFFFQLAILCFAIKIFLCSPSNSCSMLGVPVFVSFFEMVFSF